MKIFWTMFSHVQGQTFTNTHLKLPFPAGCLIPASTKAGVCCIQRAVALPSAEQEPTELTGARTGSCGQSKNEQVHQTLSILVGYSSSSPVSASVSQEGAQLFLEEWFRAPNTGGKHLASVLLWMRVSSKRDCSVNCSWLHPSSSGDSSF